MSIFFYIIFFLFPSIFFAITTKTILTIASLGKLSGLSTDTYEAFLKIPYAEPPINDLRWMPPQSPTVFLSSDEVYDSSDFPAACPQPPNNLTSWSKANMTFSEDCLYLSIWKPKKKSLEGSPVLIWLHGGSYVYGGAAESFHNGQYLAETKQIIVVVVQSRLGLLGYGALPFLKSLNPYHTTGTYGLLDQIAALKWVKNYIYAFGGNPNKITLGGFSSGASSACLMSIIPQTKNLFWQGIWHSGACWSMTKNPSEAFSNTGNVLQSLCDLKSDDALSCLKGLDATSIAEIPIEKINVMIDGYLLDEHPFLSYSKGKQDQMTAILIGNVANEGSLFTPSDVIKEYYPNYVSNSTQWLRLNSSISNQVLQNYECENDCADTLAEIYGDSLITCNDIIIGQILSQNNKTQVFSFLFSHSPSSSPDQKLGAFHGSDIPFAFHNIPNYTDDETALSDAMSNTWGHFIHGDYSDLNPFNSITNFSRINFSTPVSIPYTQIDNWKTSVCNNLWYPAYFSALDELVKNDTVKNYSKINLTIPGVGSLQGLDGDNFEAFLKIPYAEPPVGDLRWSPTVSPRVWNGSFNATSFPDPCPQIIEDFFGNTKSFNEDCLYMSVWKPKKIQKGGHPVVIWIHGGSLRFGGINDPDYNGEYMAKKGSIIFISIQYRLGILGFIGLPDLKNENMYKTTGNYGLMDQIAALRWVKKYVSAFGGNPERITIAGESAGASSVLLHLQIPYSKNLFSQVIVESSAIFVEVITEKEKYELSSKIVGRFCNFSNETTKFLSCIRNITVKQLLSINANDVSKASLDDYLLHENPYTFFKNWASRPHSNISSILIGNNKEEGTLFLPGVVNTTNYKQVIHQESPWISDEDIQNLISNVYPCLENECSLSYAELLGDAWLVCSTIICSQSLANDPSIKVYSYLFSHPPESTVRYTPFLGAYHGSEISFAFFNLPSVHDFYISSELHLSLTMAQIWIDFIVSGTFDPFYPTYSSSTNFKRLNFSTDSNEYERNISRWRENLCQNVWDPIYSKAWSLKKNNINQGK